MDNLNKTPLFQMHQKYGGKIVDFGGWALPVQFSGILEEHEAVRTKAGLFDVSHMGEVEIKGQDAEAFLQKLVVGDVSILENKQVLYTLMCYPDGGVVDDLLVYKYSTSHYFLVINASNTDKDFAWIQENLVGKVEAKNVSGEYAQLALQGPLAETVLQKLTDFQLPGIKFFYFEPQIKLAGITCLVSRTGYTGEDGFEIYLKPEDAPEIWDKILEAGQEEGVLPIGLGARDTLRFEAKLPLYGQEIDKDITPLEAGLSFFVKFNKGDFIGRDVLVKQKEEGLNRKLVGFEMIGRGIPRSHFDVQADGKEIGFVTTGSFSPTLKKNIGLAIIKTQYAELGSEIDIVIRNKPVTAKIISTPFYKKQYKK